jgi:hypothetical protein
MMLSGHQSRPWSARCAQRRVDVHAGAIEILEERIWR